MADFKPGSMDITTQTKTFDGFIKAMIWVCVVIFFVLLFMAVFTA
ncbi:aa3-type cytochrome c oxidase subunit IV [Ruegeria pomeroyi]|uniref:Aa3-type cytochrome c oxidase subunit IV n=2 Tax=Ruegeria TaxID=97050 RepID=A0A9Q3ZM93_9RHOB|nr:MULTISPECIES: aa3-type cytochrome c oxidase subunit IV [Ruegeria]MCE8512189.1 aa3-type cytochrome c oxidase subunit IV [Ruegeria pomeroyi]MCE8515319.1 aa3-type cytochrome c oxidase subunit IV [Ruegeria pomeroyi]MCE8520758.1 aa3-type cytochrome c oxidase subunit IV [Ruegeria pomeroyi]MCE8524689.1 aa3-type cytochrome c oxidase subunit IV [Ruegeria pomeroyi]MCE8528771.1 aa3-type cytochrome c oxidase subunit IV [Ruegeria pomeroyi]